MVKLLKNQTLSLGLERVFTDKNYDAYALIHFSESGEKDDDVPPLLERPDNWSAEAAAFLAEEAASFSIPAETKPIEENTLPSWLWRRAAEGKKRIKESSAKQIFHRVAGAATYTGWKRGLFAGESEARIFFDEARYLLMQRFFALEPHALGTLGLAWAYGIEPKKLKSTVPKPFTEFETGHPAAACNISVRNSTIDALLGGNKNTREKWQQFLAAGKKNQAFALRFTDIAEDWGAAQEKSPAPHAVLDLLSFRREDGPIDIERFLHAVKVLVILLDLLGAGETLNIGFVNLAPLLMGFALPYDSEAARATAGALTSIITAESYATSAQLAGLLGAADSFAAHYDSILRALRNHSRAAYGDRNDYEKVSVLPASLHIEQGADLALIAAARNRWDEALKLVKQHGLRHLQVTKLSASSALTYFLEGASQAVEPLPALVIPRATEADTYRSTIHPCVSEALEKLGYDASTRKMIIDFIGGSMTLANAPSINHAALRARGFDSAAITRLEDYLPHVNDIRLAFTPWVLGKDFCLRTLKISQDDLEDPHLDLLRRIGFTTESINAANKFCFGRNNAKGAPGLKHQHTAVLAAGADILPAARIRMAASVQSFVSGIVDLRIALPASATLEACETLLLTAWRLGVKTVTVEFEIAQDQRIDAANKDQPAKKISFAASPPSVTQIAGKVRISSTLRSKPKAGSKLVGLKGRGTKLPPSSPFKKP